MLKKSSYPHLVLAAFLSLWAGSALAAGPVYWDWPQGRSFAELETDGMAVTWDGALTRGLDHKVVGPGGPEVFWSLEQDGQGGVLVGSGHNGELYQLDKKGNPLLLAQLEGAEIFSTLALDGGDILAGCGPEGQLYRLSPDKEPVLLGKVTGGYIWDMSIDPVNGGIWLAAGSPAAIYRLGAQDKLEMVKELEAQNCLALQFQKDGTLLLGAQGPGLVYQLDPRKPDELSVLFQAAQDEVRQFILGPDDELYFLALNSSDSQDSGDSKNGKGKNGGVPASLLSLLDVESGTPVARSAIYRIGEQGRVSPHWAADLDLMIAAWSKDYGWLAGGALPEEENMSTLYRLVAHGQYQAQARWAGGDILDILVQAMGRTADRVLVAQAHPGNVVEVSQDGDGMARAESPALDGAQMVDWGRLSWSGQDPDKKLRWSVRGGNTATPDETWTAWSSTWNGNDQEIDLPASRFLQWQVEFPRKQSKQWQVHQVSISGWQENIPPVIQKLDLEKVSDISLGGMLNGSDNVTQSYRSGLKAEFSRNSRADRRAGGSRAAITRPVRVFTWQGQDPNGDRLLYTLEYLRRGDQAWRGIVEETQETIGAWDTSEVPDGMYQVRLTANDALDNPTGQNLQSQLETGPVLVDNTAPVIEEFRLEPVPEGFLVRLQCRDGASNLAGAVLYLPDGSGQRLDPVDRICDSRQESFQVRIRWPQKDKAPGALPWQVRVEVRDMAGNLAIAQGDVDLVKR